jgi:hypothetical protein
MEADNSRHCETHVRIRAVRETRPATPACGQVSRLRLHALPATFIFFFFRETFVPMAFESADNLFGSVYFWLLVAARVDRVPGLWEE